MSPRLKILKNVIEKLKNFQNDHNGQLYGVFHNKEVFIIGLSIISQKNESEEEKDNHNDINSLNSDLLPNFPANIIICGVFYVSPVVSADNIANDMLEKNGEVSVVINMDPSTKEVTTHSYDEGSVKKIKFSIFDEDHLFNTFLNLRLTSSVTLSCDFQYEYVKESFELFLKKIETGNAAFHIEGSNVYIFGDSSNDVNGISSEASVEEVLFDINKLSENKTKNSFAFLNANLFLKGTNNNKTPQMAPVIKYEKKVYKHAGIYLDLDSLAFVPKTFKLKDLYPILVESICRNLSLMKQSFLTQLKNDPGNVSLPKTYHFWLQACGHFLSVVYPIKYTSDQLKKLRETFHILLGLPMNKPLLRTGNAYDFSNSDKKNATNLLLNVHEGLGKSGVPDGQPFYVQGSYAYHHYMQDNFDDSGWGCAYRSLQTIFSWFRLQGYTNMPVPSHKEIQQCLVNIGDKPASFVGSKQWIGSTEVGFLLDTMLGVTCKIVNVSSGEEMSMKGGELSYHFRTQGTPIMIGGGVLAHTIIGIDYNKKTGAIKFLILDPHYTGSEDLKVIQSKGWCGWKGPEFWKKEVFYNMCMPLTPHCI